MVLLPYNFAGCSDLYLLNITTAALQRLRRTADAERCQIKPVESSIDATLLWSVETARHLWRAGTVTASCMGGWVGGWVQICTLDRAAACLHALLHQHPIADSLVYA